MYPIQPLVKSRFTCLPAATLESNALDPLSTCTVVSSHLLALVTIDGVEASQSDRSLIY